MHLEPQRCQLLKMGVYLGGDSQGAFFIQLVMYKKCLKMFQALNFMKDTREQLWDGGSI